MASDIQAMSAELARNPSSLVFLELGETLRRRAQLDAATRVVEAGLEQHPELIDGHDLYARTLVDAGDYAAGERVWSGVLERDPRHLGALKGLGFLYYRGGSLEQALEVLETALGVDPADQGVVRAMQTVRRAVDEAEAAAESVAGDPVFAGLEGAQQGLLLVDERGRVLGGGLGGRAGDVSEAVAAYLAGAAQEADRTARMLGLGGWEWIVAEGPEGNVYVTPPTEGTLLLIARDRSVPAGRLALLADKAGEIARAWLAEQRL
jgi:tetratricopeptide (TPR) repeat protein